MVPWAGCGVQALCFSLADIDVSKRKKMFELQPNVFRNFKWLPTLTYTLTRLIYSREIFEMFKTFLVFFFSGDRPCSRVTTRATGRLL